MLPDTRRRRPGPAARRGRRQPRPPLGDSRTALLAAAATAFSERGFDGVTVDQIARRAAINKAMIYYHFDDKLALYREIVRDMARHLGARVADIAASADPSTRKLDRFIETFIVAADERPYFPTMMLREISEGAPRLDADTLKLIRDVFLAFGRILAEGSTTGVFRAIHPVLAYITVIGPLMFNAARERVAARPGRANLPMFVAIPHHDVMRHMQQVARGMLAKDERL